MTVRRYLFVLLIGSFMPGFAQPEKSPKRSPQYPLANQFDHLSTIDGLSNNSINCMVQDRLGYMWFGTHEGLTKYDGATCTIFRPDPRQPAHSFQNSIITGLCEGSADRVWAITEGGLHEIDTKTGRVTPHLIRASKANRWNNQISIHRDNRNQLWISTFAGLARYDPARRHFTLYLAPDAESPVITTFEDRQHRLWVGTLRGIYLLNPATGRFMPMPVAGVAGPQPTVNSFYQDRQDRLWMGTVAEGYSLLRLDLRQKPWRLERYNPGGQLNPYVWRNTIHQDSTGLVWVGTSNGLQALDPVSERVVTYRTEASLSKSMGSSNAQSVYHDRAGTLWVGTDNGVDRQSATTRPFQTYRLLPNERMANRTENRVTALATDSRGQLWFSNSVTVYRQVGQQQPDIITPDKLGSVGPHINYINALVPDGLDGMWFGTQDGLYHHDPATGQYVGYPSLFPVQYISVKYIGDVPTDDLWVGGVGGVSSFNRRTHRYTGYAAKTGTPGGLPDKQVNGLLASRDWNVWVLTKGMGLCRLNPKTGVFTRFVAGPNGQLSTNEVESIYEDKAGVIWVGTHLGGLNRLDPRTGLFSAITQQDGIPGNSILGITGDDAGQLWLSTDKGLCRFDPTTKAIHSYDVMDGLPSNQFLQNAVFRQKDGLFFGSQNGYVRFDPNRILDDTRPFPVYVNALTVLDKPRPLTDSLIRLRHDETMFSVGFAALAYEQPGQNQYAYQLVGVNPDWVQNENRHVANFTNLAPGSYTFRVKAANSNGFWSPNVASVQVIVSPPWWATWWAYGLYALLAAGAIWAYIRFYTNRIKQQQELVFNRQQAEQLKAVDELKTRFFSNITHEFRTPLALIIAPVEKLLQENRFDRPMLTTVQRNAEQLLRLINQLLDLSKLEGNYMAVSAAQGSIPEFIEQVVAVFGRAAEQKGVTLRCEVAGLPLNEYVFDADKWEKILTNLLSNSLKFSDAGGGVTLTALPARRGNELAGVQIQLVDSGIGISATALPHIFDRFYQADTSSTRAHEGTGIGLALVHELVGLLGGTIAVESEPGAGTTFRLMLPVQSVSATAHVPRLDRATANRAFVIPPVVPITTLSNGHSTDGQLVSRVLVVEDNDELRAFLVGELAQSYHVLEAADGEAGWAICQTELPDIVLTDLMMPRMNGYELTRRIKNHPDTDHIAVVMLTAKAAQQSRIEGLQRGADDYLAKPFSIDELHLRLRNLISRQQKLGEHYRRQFTLFAEPLDHLDPAPVPVPPDPFLGRIYGLLDAHLDNSALGVDWLADQLAMTRKTLYRKVHSLIQLPPADLIRQYRLRRATDLLRRGHTVTETADLVGFSTPSHFAVVFKEFYQQTPTEFMNNRVKGA